MTEPNANTWPPPIRYPVSEAPQGLTQRQMTRLRYRWGYTAVALIMVPNTVDQYFRHDPWGWVGLLAAVGNSVLAVTAWRLKWRLDREQRDVTR